MLYSVGNEICSLQCGNTEGRTTGITVMKQADVIIYGTKLLVKCKLFSIFKRRKTSGFISKGWNSKAALCHCFSSAILFRLIQLHATVPSQRFSSS